MKTYQKHEVAHFLKTRELNGGLSNMAPGYPITLYGVRCKTSEHLYQSLKFPNNPEIQLEILAAPSPIGAKMIAKRLAYRHLIRPDWEDIKLPVMGYCLRAKLKCNFQKFSELLLSTGNADIVEISSKRDTYWGCVPEGELLVGQNHLGVLLTDLRDELANEGPGAGHRMKLTPPAGVELRFNGRTVGEFQFGYWDETSLDEFLAAIRIKHANQPTNSTIGGN